MKINKGFDVERNKFDTAVVRKRAIQIYNKPCTKCPFALPPDNKVGFYACCNPYLIYKSIVKNYGKIINCSDESDYSKCEFANKTESKLLNDFIRIKKLIKAKKMKGIYLHIDSDEVDKLIDHLRVHNKVYLEALMVYFGYIYINDDKVDGLLFTNNYEYIKENFFIMR